MNVNAQNSAILVCLLVQLCISMHSLLIGYKKRVVHGVHILDIITSLSSYLRNVKVYTQSDMNLFLVAVVFEGVSSVR